MSSAGVLLAFEGRSCSYLGCVLSLCPIPTPYSLAICSNHKLAIAKAKVSYDHWPVAGHLVRRGGGGVIKQAFSQFGVGLDLGWHRVGNKKHVFTDPAPLLFLCRGFAPYLGCPQVVSSASVLLALLGRSGMLWEKPFSQFGVGLDLERRRVGKHKMWLPTRRRFFVCFLAQGVVSRSGPYLGCPQVVSSDVLSFCPACLSGP